MIPQEADQTHIEYGFPVFSPRSQEHSCADILNEGGNHRGIGGGGGGGALSVLSLFSFNIGFFVIVFAFVTRILNCTDNYDVTEIKGKSVTDHQRSRIPKLKWVQQFHSWFRLH